MIAGSLLAASAPIFKHVRDRIRLRVGLAEHGRTHLLVMPDRSLFTPTLRQRRIPTPRPWSNLTLLGSEVGCLRNRSRKVALASPIRSFGGSDHPSARKYGGGCEAAASAGARRFE